MGLSALALLDAARLVLAVAGGALELLLALVQHPGEHAQRHPAVLGLQPEALRRPVPSPATDIVSKSVLLTLCSVKKCLIDTI